jgi:chorismate mutase
MNETSKAIHDLTKLIGHYHIQEVKLSTERCDYYLTHLLAIVAERDALAAEVADLKAAANPLAKRKVVQLIALPLEGQTMNEVYALCDDGTMWNRIEPQGWSQTLGIPQPEQPEQEGQR